MKAENAKCVLNTEKRFTRVALYTESNTLCTLASESKGVSLLASPSYSKAARTLIHARHMRFWTVKDDTCFVQRKIKQKSFVY